MQQNAVVTPQSQAQMVLRDDDAGKRKLAAMLHKCFDTLKLYGREPESLDAVQSMFAFVLGCYPIALIEKGFCEYIGRNDEMPTPANIRNIIDPPPPTPDWAAYVGIRQKIRDGIWVMQEQRDYVAWCENYVTSALKTHLERDVAQTAISALEQKMLPAG